MNMLELMRIGPVIPVIVIDHLEHAVPLAKALVVGGVRVLEVTLRTPVALQAIRAIVSEVDGAIVGVGTITRAKDFARSIEAGASFGVSPGLTPELVAGARDSGLPLLPGVMTPSDVIAARAAGFNEMKLFPAQQAGGIGMLKALGTVPRCHLLSYGGRLGRDGRRLSGSDQCRLRRRILANAIRRCGGR